MFSKITFNSPWYFILISIVLSVLLSYWLYFKNKKQETPKQIFIFLFVLRFLSLFFICMFLLSIFLKYFKNETENPIILLAIDNSKSMLSGNDSTFINTEFVKKLNLFKEHTGEKYTIETIVFGSKSEVSKTDPVFTEKETDFSELLAYVENNYSNQNIGALIIASDGIYNKGSNPKYAAEKLNYPIYTIATGDTSENKDVWVQKINHNQVAYLGNNFPVEVIVNSKKYLGKEVVLSIFENGNLKDKRILKINSENFVNTSTFTLSAQKTGLINYSAKVTVLDGEKNYENNSQDFIIDVIDNKEKILLLVNAPHPDISALKEAIESRSNYELEYSSANDFKNSLKPYSLVIMHGFAINHVQLINECKTNAIPFWIINPQSTEHLPGVKINSSFNRYNETEPYVDNSFSLFGLSAELRNFLKQAPALKSFFGNYITLNSTNTLINQRLGEVETENPILIFTELNGLKCAVFIGDGLWKWKLRDFVDHKNSELFNELISKSIQYLAVKNDKSLFRLSTKKIINENEAVEFFAEVYNKSYELVTESDVNLVLTNYDRKKFNYSFGKVSNTYKLNAGLLPPGEYTYEASVKSDNNLLTKQGRISVRELVAERINTVANHLVLFQLSQLTKGKLFYPNQLNNLEEELLKNENIKAITYTQSNNSPLIDLKWLFFMILGLQTLEWLIRKRYLHI